MPVMSKAERWCCQSRPWRWMAGRLILGWALQGVTPRGAVLEVGGGSGAMAAETIRRYPEVELTVTDVDPAMVTAAQRRFAVADTPLASVCRADATQLPFADGAFDVVVSYLMLHHVIEWRRALGEVSRVLRPGGRFVGYDLVATPLMECVHWADRSPHRLVERNELGPALSQAGLGAVCIRATVGRQAVRFTARRPD